MPSIATTKNVNGLFTVVESFVTETWESPGAIRDCLIEAVARVPEVFRDDLPGRPYSAERVRAVLEILAQEPRSPIERRRNPHARDPRVQFRLRPEASDA